MQTLDYILAAGGLLFLGWVVYVTLPLIRLVL